MSRLKKKNLKDLSWRLKSFCKHWFSRATCFCWELGFCTAAGYDWSLQASDKQQLMLLLVLLLEYASLLSLPHLSWPSQHKGFNLLTIMQGLTPHSPAVGQLGQGRLTVWGSRLHNGPPSWPRSSIFSASAVHWLLHAWLWSSCSPLASALLIGGGGPSPRKWANKAHKLSTPCRKFES